MRTCKAYKVFNTIICSLALMPFCDVQISSLHFMGVKNKLNQTYLKKSSLDVL